MKYKLFFYGLKNRMLLLFLVCMCCNSIYAKKLEDYWVEKYFSVSFPLRSIKINSSYGTRIDPLTGKTKQHLGIDLQARYEEAYAMFDGIVEKVGQGGPSGKYIIMRHGEYTISYCHLSKIYVKEGDYIFASDIVGITGNTGRSTGAHLHITTKLNGVHEDPFILLQYINDTKKEALLALRLEETKILPPRDFIAKYAGVAMKHQRIYGIPSSVTLAQMCLESAYGSSNLAQSASNYFGIKASSNWLKQGLPFVLKNDDSPNEKFCIFDNAESSIEYHSKLLTSKRYHRCYLFSPTDYHNWLVEIKRAGYASDPQYIRRCEGIIKKYKLYLYDYEAERT